MKHAQTVMSARVRRDVGIDPEYTRCGLQGLLQPLIGPCGGRVTREHAVYFAGRKVQEKWAIPPVCEKHHGVGPWLDAPEGVAPKEVRLWVAVNRASLEELFSVSKAVSYIRERDRLNAKYGEYLPPPVPRTAQGVDKLGIVSS